jgi:hypothetical protein
MDNLQGEYSLSGSRFVDTIMLGGTYCVLSGVLREASNDCASYKYRWLVLSFETMQSAARRD